MSDLNNEDVVVQSPQASVDVEHLEINQEPSLTSTSWHRELSFQIPIIKGALDATPQEGFFLEWSIVTNPAEIDGVNEEGTEETEVIPDDLTGGALGLDDEPENDLDANAILQYGQALDTAHTPPLASPSALPPLRSEIPLPLPGPLTGYNYTEFNPKPYDRSLPGQSRSAPTQA